MPETKYPAKTEGKIENSSPASSTKRLLDKKHWCNLIIPGNGIVADVFGKTKEECEQNAVFIMDQWNREVSTNSESMLTKALSGIIARCEGSEILTNTVEYFSAKELLSELKAKTA